MKKLLLSILLFSSVLVISSPSEEAAKLPKVLIIGDSISIGYTPHVKEMLKDTAEVIHNQGNAQHTRTGLEQIDSWLGKTKWAVIHFNWGLWDLAYRGKAKRDKLNKKDGKLTTTLEEYEKNLDKLVTRLEKTGAKLIWGSISFVPEGESGRILGDDLRYNEVAAKVMEKHGVPINDINALTRTFDQGLFIRPGNVHYKPDGSKKIAEQVVAKIKEVLK